MNEGVRKDSSEFIFDYDKDYIDDIINLCNPVIHKSEFHTNTYYFGYEFNDIDSKIRTDFIHFIKGLLDNKPSTQQLERFIDTPLIMLQNYIDMNNLKCILYPTSNRSELVKHIIHEINCIFPRMTKTSCELFKSIPSDIKFDWNSFDMEFEGDRGTYRQVKKYITDVLMPKINNLEYFSIAANVKVKYRKYIQDYLYIPEKDKNTLQSISSGDVLIIDDINTSGSTLEEIIRQVRSINKDCNIYIFTLIGK